MASIKLTDENKDLFLYESIEILMNLKNSLDEKSKFISVICLDDYMDKMSAIGDGLEKITEKIDDFLNRWDKDNYQVCDTISAMKNYIMYYIRLCDCSSPCNFKVNSLYIEDSIKTILIVINSKLEKIKNSAFNKI